MNWDNFYHDEEEILAYGDAGHYIDVYGDMYIFSEWQYMTENNITIDWLEPQNMLGLDIDKWHDEWCEQVKKETIITSNTFPANNGTMEINVEEYYFNTVFVAVKDETKFYVRLIKEPVEYSYLRNYDDKKFVRWKYFLYKFNFAKEGEDVWKRCDEAESPADAICLTEIHKEYKRIITHKNKPNGKWGLHSIRPIYSHEEFDHLVNKNLIDIMDICNVAENCRIGMKDNEFEFEE